MTRDEAWELIACLSMVFGFVLGIIAGVNA